MNESENKRPENAHPSPTVESGEDGFFPEPVVLPLSDVLDLHTFRPGEVPHLLKDYLGECREAGILSVRIIHGKGSGILKKRVQGLLAKDDRVASFVDAPPQAGGWGATLVRLKRP